MAIGDRSERAVDSTIRELREEYGAFDVVEKTWELPPSRYRTVLERFDRECLGGAGVWITNDAGDVLLVRNEGDDGWGDPGGKVEPGESYETAAKREVREETGVECRLTGICDVHTVANRCADSDEPPIFEAIVIFRGEYVEGEPRPRDGEIAEVGWFSRPPATVLYEEIRTRPYPARG